MHALDRITKYRMTRAIALVLSGLLLATASWAEAENSPQNWLAGFEDEKPITLTDRKVSGFIAATRELQDGDFNYEPEADSDGPSIDGWAAAIEADDRVQSIIKRHGFSNGEDFARTTYSVTMAIGATEMQNHSEEIKQAQAQLAQMKDQLPPETYAMMEQQVLGAMKLFGDQPEGNLALVAKYREELEKLSNSDQGSEDDDQEWDDG